MLFFYFFLLNTAIFYIGYSIIYYVTEGEKNMAKENLVMLRGIMVNDIMVYRNDSDQTPIYCTGTIMVAKQERSVRSNQDKENLSLSEVRIASRDANVINKIKDAKRGDIVGLKGVIGTLRQTKRTVCPDCGRPTSYIGQVLFVAPTFVEMLGHVDTNEEASQYLAEHRDISNIVRVFGLLVRDPGRIHINNKFGFTQYQLAVNRKLRVSFDQDPANHADYPWVKSYGIIGKRDRERLFLKSEIYVDGFLQSRSVMKHVVCGQKLDDKGKPMKDCFGNPIIATDENGEPLGCGKRYETQERTSEIVPYATEYIGNYRSDEEAEEYKRQIRNQSITDLANQKTRLTIDYDLEDEEDEDESVIEEYIED